MAHQAQREFCARVRARFPTMFVSKDVLDVGSLDVNGNNRYLFTGGTYLGCDIIAGKNVDHVGPIWTLPNDRQFDVIVSTEMLEHDAKWVVSIHYMIEKLRPGGLLLLTCAGPGRGKHGFGPKKEGWETMHYRNLSPHDFSSAGLDESVFRHFSIEYEGDAKDTYFWGIKRA